MSIHIVDYPLRNIETGIPCIHSAAHNAVLFKFFRFDYGYGAAVTADAGVNTVFTLGTAVTSPPFVIGQTVYVKALAGGPYDQAAIVLDVPDSTHVKLNVPYTAASSNGFINCDQHFQNYYLQLKIVKLNPVTMAEVSTIAEPIFRPLPNGDIRADVSAYLKALGANENGINAAVPFNYSGYVNAEDEESGGVYRAYYREAFIGGLGSYAPLSRFYWINAAKQILDPYSGNMADYVPQIYNTVANPDRIKFLTEFRQPTYFPGFPFDLSFVYWDETPIYTDAAQVIRSREFFNINGGSISISTTNLDRTKKNRVNRLLCEDPLPGGTDHLPAGTKSLDMWLDDGQIFPPPGTIAFYVGYTSMYADNYNYHSIERGVHVGSVFTITTFTVNGVDKLFGLPPQIINITNLSQVHYEIGQNGSVQFKNLVDLVNSLVSPTLVKFFDDFAICCIGGGASFVLEILYDDGIVPPATWAYHEDGFYFPGGTPNYPYGLL